MKGFNKQKKHLKKIREEKSLRTRELKDEDPNESSEGSNNEIVTSDSKVQCNSSKKMDPVCSAMATLASGGTFTSSSKFCAHMNQPYVCKSSFYKGQKIVAQEVKQYALESMQQARDQFCVFLR